MYLMGFVNSAFEAQRPTGNLELVDLSLANKYHPPEVRKEHSNGQSQSCRMTTTSMENNNKSSSSSSSNSSIHGGKSTLKAKPITSKPRRTSLEDLPADLYMEPLSPVLLRSPERWVPEETPVNWLQEDLASGQLAQEWWSFCIGKPKNDLHATRMKTFTSTFESVFADGGISIRVEHHPLESSSSEDEFYDAIGNADEGCAQLLQHLESIEKAKVPLQQQQQQHGDAGDEPDLRGVPIPSSKSKVPSAFSPSLSSPMMEKMEAHSWINNAKLMKQSPEVQDELLFRPWEREDSGFLADETCAISNDLSNEMSTPRSDGDVKKTCKPSPPNVDALLNLKTFDLYSRRRRGTKTPTTEVVQVHVGKAVESEQDYPSPSSFTCGLSSTSLFSDDEDPFPLSVSNSDNNMFHAFNQQFCSELVNPCEEQRSGFRKSPRSVLSQEPDEISHGTSDSSETTSKHPRKQQQQIFSYLYNDESSDLDSPMQSGFKYQLPFPAFTCDVNEDMGATTSSSSSDEEEVVVAGSLQELGIFHEANQREPWLVNDGGVVDDSEDLEFLLSPTILHGSQLRNGLPTLIQTLASQEMPETAGGRIRHESPKTKDGSPKTHHEGPKTHRQSPKTEHESPNLTKDETLKTKRESPKTENESPKTKDETLKTKFERTKTKRESPKTENESPKTENESPKTKDETLKTKYERAKTKRESPKTEHESPNLTKDETLKTKRESPKTKCESPKTKHGSPKTKDENLKTKYEGPNTKHDSMRRPIGENKWVPYVTSRLYDNSPPRGQRNPIKRPQNPIFDNPAHGGKTSVTNFSRGEFDKAPKRSVNFAPDLVKEIPYTTTPTTTTPSLKHNPVAPPSKKTWEVEEEGPSIMTSHRNRWRRHRDSVVDDSNSNSNSKPSPSPGGSSRWSSWSFAETRGRVAHAVPSCTGRLLSWPKKLAFKVSNSRRWNVDSDEESFVGDGSFGVSARRDAELVRRILKGSQKKYSNLNETDILKGDFG